jgi:hypothetical protein
MASNITSIYVLITLFCYEYGIIIALVQNHAA